MPVGTAGTVKAMYPEQVRETGADILLGNTYHLMLRPGAERVASLGGLHKFMDWERPILTDSGGFQVMSLAKLRKLDRARCDLPQPYRRLAYELTPERSIEIQTLLDSDIIMQLDECLALPAPREEMERAMELSLRWGDALEGRVRRPAAPGAVRHRAGRRRSGAAGALGGGAPRDRFRRLLGRRACGRRAAGDDVPRDRRHHARPAAGPAALPDGRRQARRHSRRHRARHRHVRLRPPHARRPPRPRLHPVRRHQSEERAA